MRVRFLMTFFLQKNIQIFQIRINLCQKEKKTLWSPTFLSNYCVWSVHLQKNWILIVKHKKKMSDITRNERTESFRTHANTQQYTQSVSVGEGKGNIALSLARSLFLLLYTIRARVAITNGMTSWWEKIIEIIVLREMVLAIHM